MAGRLLCVVEVWMGMNPGHRFIVAFRLGFLAGPSILQTQTRHLSYSRHWDPAVNTRHSVPFSWIFMLEHTSPWPGKEVSSLSWEACVHALEMLCLEVLLVSVGKRDQVTRVL